MWNKTPISGKGTTVNKFSDIDYMLNVEWFIKLSKKIENWYFFYKLKYRKDPTINNKEFITKQIEDRIYEKLKTEMGLDDLSAKTTTGWVMDALENTIIPGTEDLTPIQDVLNDTLAAEWTDIQSVGIFVSYSF